MLYTGVKKEAKAIHERAIKKYEETYNKVENAGKELYQKRIYSVALIKEIEGLVNSIANHPKEFEKIVADIRFEYQKFHQTEEYMKESCQAAAQSGAGIAAGILGGASVAGAAPTAAMWIATTFGKASTGRAISTLSGIAAKKAALAWLGGGTLTAGGAGAAGGQALLALAGPVGWGISGITTAASIATLGIKNKKIASKMIEEAKNITLAGAELNESRTQIVHIMEETILLYDNLKAIYGSNVVLKGSNYLSLKEEEQYSLGALVNDTLTLAQLINRTI